MDMTRREQCILTSTGMSCVSIISRICQRRFLCLFSPGNGIFFHSAAYTSNRLTGSCWNKILRDYHIHSLRRPPLNIKSPWTEDIRVPDVELVEWRAAELYPPCWTSPTDECNWWRLEGEWNSLPVAFHSIETPLPILKHSDLTLIPHNHHSDRTFTSHGWVNEFLSISLSRTGLTTSTSTWTWSRATVDRLNQLGSVSDPNHNVLLSPGHFLFPTPNTLMDAIGTFYQAAHLVQINSAWLDWFHWCRADRLIEMFKRPLPMYRWRWGMSAPMWRGRKLLQMIGS